MRATFATETANVTSFLSAVTALERRGAREACLMLVTGEAGHGKSRTVKWYVVQEEGVYLRAKADWTPHWLLTELATELGLSPDRATEGLHAQVLASLAKHPRPLVVDEVEHCLADRRVLETIRDISDLTEVPTILVGMDGVERRLQRHPQIYSRITQIVAFRPLSDGDIAGIIRELCEVPVADDALPVIVRQTAGYIREVMDAIAEVERLGRRGGGPVTAASLAGVALTGGRVARPAARRR